MARIIFQDRCCRILAENCSLPNLKESGISIMLGWYNISMSIDNDESIEEQSKFFGEALKCFDKALEIDPKYTYAWYCKGNHLLTKKTMIKP
jgi:tetratricopeptide (TPR) repeat protein